PTAQRVLENALGTTPDSADAHGQLGLLLNKANQFRAAAKELERAVQLAPDSATYALAFAEALLLSNEPFRAVHLLTEVRVRFETLPEFGYKLALAYYSLNQYTKAIAELEHLSNRYPNLDLVPYFLGNSYAAMADVGNAETFYKRAVDLNPTNASYY